MNIQPSLIIWTVICFGLLMLVLDRLLFKPVLKHMDDRKKKVEDARAAAKEREQERQRLEAELLEKAQLAAAEKAAEEKKLVSDFRAETEAELKELSRSLEERNAEQKERNGELLNEAFAAVGNELDGMAKAYADKLLKGGKQ